MVEGKCTYTLPFDVCKFCPNFSPDMLVTDLFGDGKIVGNGITIVCSKEQICQNFYRMLEKDNDIVRKAMDNSQN